jgi:DNA polymerase III epsilon subunit-like protein
MASMSHSPSAPAVREIVVDTETTGLGPSDGHRIVEIGASELINRSPNGQTFHRYLNPDRNMPADAVAVHRLTAAHAAFRETSYSCKFGPDRPGRP